jgi:tungstate transport system permease protein
LGSLSYITEGFTAAIGLLFSGDPETYSAVWTTIAASSLSMLASLIIGVPLGFCLGHFEFRARRILRTMVDALLAFPTVAIGLLVYAFLSRKGPLGDFELLFTVSGMALGQTLLALPIVVALTATAVESLDRRLGATLRTLGASARQAALTTLWEARYAVLAAAVTAYGRVVSEVGISMMVGGNIKWHTRTITTAITLETGKGEFSMGIALGLVLLALAVAVNLCLTALRKRART